MKFRKKLIIAGIIILFFCIFLYFFKKINTEESFTQGQQEEKTTKEIFTYSRLNFFLSSQNKASLAIPDFWEGNYRVKEQGNEVKFYFVKGATNEVELFSIKYVEKNIDNSFSENEIIGDNEKYNFVFKKSEIINLDDNIYYKIVENIDETIKSFKVS